MFLAHAPISYLSNEIIQKRRMEGLKPSQTVLVTVLSLLFGILPDIDFLIMMMTDRPSYTHHDSFTHTPIYWVGLWLVISLVFKLIYPKFNTKTKQFLTKDVVKIILNSLLIGGISHYLADLVVGNIMIFYPLTTQNFTLLKYIFEPSYFTGYFLSVFFALELILFVIGLISLSKKFMYKQRWDNVLGYILLSLTSIYLIFTIFLNTQTYNRSFLKNDSKPYIDYDVDFDGLRDIEDMDVDNDGIDNILDVEKENVVTSVRRIVDSNKLSVDNDSGIKDWIVSKWGGLTTYRVISQAYYENFSPIEPVLKDFYLKSLDKKKYTVSFDYKEVLREYLLSKNLLIDLNLDSNPLLSSGEIFFLIDKDGNILNMGMTLENNEIAIVLPGEDHIQYHTYDGLKLFYKDIPNLKLEISQ
jgi:hypothetical protein